MDGRLAEPAGYYRLIDGSGAGLFAKVVPAAHVERQAGADRIASQLGRAGVPAITVLPDFPKEYDANHAVFAYPYFAARFAKADCDELFRVGACIATIHLAMNTLDCREEIRRAAAIRVGGLLARRDHIVRGDEGPWVPQGLRQMLTAQASLLELLLDQDRSQPIHGDLVYANVLLPLREGPPIVVDYEDALISWHPPIFDLAQAIERFALEAEIDDSRAFDLGAALLRGYLSVAARGALSGPSLRYVLELLALRALLVLADMAAAGQPVEPGEWRKFFRLYGQAGSRAEILERLDRICRA